MLIISFVTYLRVSAIAIALTACILGTSNSSTDVLYDAIATDNTAFSGVYSPNIRYAAEDFSGAVLLAKPRFYASPHSDDSSLNKIVRMKCKGCNTFMTIDYFDFLVENPSSAMNLIPKVDKPHTDKLLAYLTTRLESTRDKLKEVATAQRLNSDYSTNNTSSNTNSVIAVLLYESSDYGNVATKHKQLILEASFWSTYRYYKNVVIAVSCSEERKIVKLMRLPVHSVLTVGADSDITYTQQQHPPPPQQRQQQQQQQQHHDKSLQWKNLLDVYNRWKADPAWKDFQYLYYSLGDLILHQRHSERLLDVLNVASEGNFIIVPHRMQTIPLMNFFPSEYHKHWATTQSFQYLPNIKLHTHNLVTASPNRCCESGRYHFSKCETTTAASATATVAPWYNCPQWGLQNFSEWVQFGTDGFMMPTASVHQGACKYSEGTDLCPVESGCRGRVPQLIGPSGSGKYKFCEETHHVRINSMHSEDISDPVIRAERLQLPTAAEREEHSLLPGHFAYCAKYEASRTYHGMTNFATCDMYVCNGTKLSISLCSAQSECRGNTLLRLYDSLNQTIQYAGNDNYCGQCSQIVFNFEKPCQWYTIREGCSGSSSCGGRVIVKEFKSTLSIYS